MFQAIDQIKKGKKIFGSATAVLAVNILSAYLASTGVDTAWYTEAFNSIAASAILIFRKAQDDYKKLTGGAS